MQPEHVKVAIRALLAYAKLSNEEKLNALQDLAIEVRADGLVAEVDAQIKRYKDEDADPAYAETCNRRTKARKLRDLAERHERMANEDELTAKVSLESAEVLRKKADELDPPKPSGVISRTLYMWSITNSTGGTSGSEYVIEEPSRELEMAIHRAVEAFNTERRGGPQNDWRIQANPSLWSDRSARVHELRRFVFRGLTFQLGSEVFNNRDKPEGKVWAKAQAMFEEFRDNARF